MVALSTTISRKSLSADDLLVSDAPLGFAARDANLTRYVGNHPTIATDPDGLEEKKKEPPTAATLIWSDFPEVATSPKGGSEGANISVIPVAGGKVAVTSNPKGGKIDVVYTFEMYTFKYVFNPKKSYQVTDMATDPLLVHEKLHLKMYEYMAAKFQAYMKTQMLKGTWDNAKAASEAKDNYLGLKIEVLNAFAKQVQDVYDHQTEHSVGKEKQKEWEKNWQAYIDAYWKKYPTPPPVK